jgi:ligand-binding SRPBCC domain-containing protein
MINAPADAVWMFVADPKMMMAWNPKVVKVSKINSGELQTGDSYTITYRMNSRDSAMRASVIRADKPRHLHIRMVNQLPGDPQGTVDEVYDLTGKGDQTVLEQNINADIKINFFLNLLIKFILRFGRPSGERYLQTLKNLVEDEVHS